MIMHLDAPQIGNPDFVMAMKYLQNRQQILNSVLLGYGSIGNDHPIAPSSPLLRQLPPSARVRSGQGEVVAAEGWNAGQKRRAGQLPGRDGIRRTWR